MHHASRIRPAPPGRPLAVRVLFVLPAPVRIPMGGAAVVYRHAEGLAARGHAVTVAAPRRQPGVRGRVLRAAVRVRDRLHRVADAPLYRAAGVETVEPATVGGLGALSFDAVIATGHQTAPWVASITEENSARPSASPGRSVSGRGGRGGRPIGLYLLQHDERHLSPAAEATWHLPLVRVAVARWIAETVEAHGAPVLGVVPNAVDPGEFALDRPLDGRERRVVALYHRLAVKGPDVLIDALDRLRQLCPDVGADVVAARPPRHRLPEWVRVHVRPSRPALRALYNRAAVCLHTARLEGWGLVPHEAATCGCAVVATASRGVAEFLEPGRSMRQVPVGDAEALALAAASLLADDAARVRLAAAAVVDAGRFSWDASTAALESFIRQSVCP